jgi:hypothetical protein
MFLSRDTVHRVNAELSGEKKIVRWKLPFVHRDGEKDIPEGQVGLWQRKDVKPKLSPQTDLP